MCGSGTFLIEAAMMAQNIAPGLFRRKFGFMHWKDYDELLWKKVKQEAVDAKRKSNIQLFGSDISPVAISKAQRNVHAAEIDVNIDFQVTSSFLQSKSRRCHANHEPWRKSFR
jgi:putative N6-adenine-specific DNA methylase